MTEAEKRKKRPWGKYILRGILCAFAGLVILEVQFVAARPARQAAAVEEMIARIPEVKCFVAERVALFEEVEATFEDAAQREDFIGLNGWESDVYVWRNKSATVLLADSTAFSEEEKEKIMSLFGNNEILTGYNSRQFLLNEETYNQNDLAELRLAKVADDEVEDWLSIAYYMEEVVEGWYAYVTPVRHPDIFLKLAEYKARRADGGLVRLSE